jgi:hypothetical protein
MTGTAGVPRVSVYVQEQHVRVRELQAEYDKMEDRVRAEAAQKADLQVSYVCCSWTGLWQEQEGSTDSCMTCTVCKAPCYIAAGHPLLATWCWQVGSTSELSHVRLESSTCEGVCARCVLSLSTLCAAV